MGERCRSNAPARGPDLSLPRPLLLNKRCPRVIAGMRSSKHKLRFCIRWEMQTGVMAYRRNERVAAFWEETRKVAHARQTHTRRCIPPLSRRKRT